MRIFISLYIPPEISDDMLKDYVFSYGLKYSGQKNNPTIRFPEQAGKPFLFIEQHNPVSIIPLNEFRQERNRIFTTNESHTLPSGLNTKENFTVTVIDPIIGDVNDEKSFHHQGIKGISLKGIHSYSGESRNTGTFPRIVTIRRIFAPHDANELRINTDLVFQTAAGPLADSSEMGQPTIEDSELGIKQIYLTEGKLSLLGSEDLLDNAVTGLSNTAIGVMIIIFVIIIVIIVVIISRRKSIL